MAKRPKINNAHINLLMPSTLLKRVQKVAHTNGTTVSKVMRDAIEAGLRSLE